LIGLKKVDLCLTLCYNSFVELINQERNKMNSFRGYEVRELSDPVQTHAVYGVPWEQVPTIKAGLRKIGATNFRTVQPIIKGSKIVCFKLKEAQ
jgi:hypothetical protein